MAESRRIRLSLCFPWMPVTQRGSQETVEQSQAATGDHGKPTVRNQTNKMEGTDLGKRREFTRVLVSLSPITSFTQKLFGALDMPLVCL